MTLILLAQRAIQVPNGDIWLGLDEKEVLGRLRFPRRREDWRLGRWTAKLAVAAWLGRSTEGAQLAELGILSGPGGAPEAFLGDTPLPLSISISHRGGRAICAVVAAPGRVGCDLELIEGRSDAFVRDYLTERERADVAAAGEGDRALAASLIWSAKESVLKALREGLRLDTRSVEVQETNRGDAGEGWGHLAVRHAATGDLFRGWWARDGDCVVTVVSDPPPAEPPPPLDLS